MSEPSTFSYGLPTRNLFLGFVVGSCMSAVSVFAFVDSWGIRAFGAILEPDLARYLYAVLALLGLMTLGATIVAKMTGDRSIEVGDHFLRAPMSEFSKQVIEVPFETITGVETAEYNQTYTLVIHHAGGDLKLRSPNFGSLELFAGFSDEVAARMSKTMA